jgi:hypothetical protein
MNPPEFNLAPSEPQAEWYDREVCTAEAWPLPQIRAWNPVQRSLLERISVWLGKQPGVLE